MFDPDTASMLVAPANARQSFPDYPSTDPEPVITQPDFNNAPPPSRPLVSRLIPRL